MNDFLIFPWDRPFLADLKNRVMADTVGKPGLALIIVPNERPWQYFRQLFAADHQAVVLPRMMTSAEVNAIWRRHCCGAARLATLLDQVYYLRKCVQTLGKQRRSLGEAFEAMDMARFLPWGVRLANLLDEIFSQSINPPDISVAEGDVHRYGIALLESLASISSTWQAMLDQLRMTTPGYDAWLASAHANSIPPQLLPRADRPIYIAGFSILNGSQKKLFKSLWEHGATMCFHADAELTKKSNLQNSSDVIVPLAKAWNTHMALVDPATKHKPVYSYFAAYDSHSQLEQLVRDRQEQQEGSTAIVLLDSDLLAPTLHHLEDKNVNISMGFPLARAPLCGLINHISELLLKRLPDGRIYWRDLHQLLHHPLVVMIRSRSGETFRQGALHILDRLLRGEEKDIDLGKYVDPDEFLNLAKGKIPRWFYRLLFLAWEQLLRPLAEAQTPAALAAILDRTMAFLGRYALGLPRNGTEEGGRQYPLDTEALVRLRDNVLPLLAGNALADEIFPLATLRDMLAALLEQERVPFRAFPLLGTQILGMLETRLLHFDHIYLLDASDDILPGRNAPDPLLPDNLRSLIGLPQNYTRSQVAAYNLERLCANARTVHFYWMQGQSSSPLAQGKKSRSRFVEQLLWKEEQRRKSVLKIGEGPLGGAESRPTVHRGAPLTLHCPDPVKVRVGQLLQGKLSARMLNTYISCPAKFAYEYVLHLHAPAEVNEEEDRLLLGNCVHYIMSDLYEPFVGKSLPADKDARLEYLNRHFGTIFQRRTDFLNLERKLPVFSWLYFKKAAPNHIYRYFLTQPEDIRPLALERNLDVVLPLQNNYYRFTGRMDRLDERDIGRLILDYKTGKPRGAVKDVWKSEEFFERLEGCLDSGDFHAPDVPTLADIRDNFSDVQLPLYMLMAANSEAGIATNAAWVWLTRQHEQEDLLWPEDLAPELGLERCALLIGFIVRHLANCDSFVPTAEHCEHCGYYDSCYLGELDSQNADNDRVYSLS